MTPVNQNGESNCRWASVIIQSIKSRPDSSTAKKNIVN
jgi:hypothetical protein